MGTWGYGPFDNDTAADFAADLDETPESGRLGKLYDALLTVSGSTGRIDGARAEVAVAAAALAARELAGGEEFQPQHYGPVNPIPSIPNDIITAAAAAVDCIIRGDNDLKVYWNGTRDSGEWLAAIKRLHKVLARDPSADMDPLW